MSVEVKNLKIPKITSHKANGIKIKEHKYYHTEIRLES